MWEGVKSDFVGVLKVTIKLEGWCSGQTKEPEDKSSYDITLIDLNARVRSTLKVRRTREVIDNEAEE